MHNIVPLCLNVQASLTIWDTLFKPVDVTLVSNCVSLARTSLYLTIADNLVCCIGTRPNREYHSYGYSVYYFP